MICGKHNRAYYYCRNCKHNPDNRPWADIWTERMEYPQIEPISGDCLSYEDDAEVTHDAR